MKLRVSYSKISSLIIDWFDVDFDRRHVANMVETDRVSHYSVLY